MIGFRYDTNLIWEKVRRFRLQRRSGSFSGRQGHLIFLLLLCHLPLHTQQEFEIFFRFNHKLCRRHTSLVLPGVLMLGCILCLFHHTVSNFAPLSVGNLGRNQVFCSASVCLPFPHICRLVLAPHVVFSSAKNMFLLI